jgi:hypothetical protein
VESHRVRFKSIASGFSEERNVLLITKEYTISTFRDQFLNEITISMKKLLVQSPYPGYEVYLMIQPFLIEEARDYFYKVPYNQLAQSEFK